MDDSREGFTLLELMIVVAIIFTLLAVSIPHLLHSKRLANEAIARESLHTLNSALFQYWTLYRVYPAALVNLAAGAQIGETSADLIDPVLASGNKSGYSFVYVPRSDLDGGVSGYGITATPTVVGLTGNQSFLMDQTGIIHLLAAPLAANSDPLTVMDAAQK